MLSRLPPLHPLMLAIGLLATTLHAAAQTTPQRVEITGSSIKRIDGETALPVQVIKREDIEKSGLTTAAELLKTISANTAPARLASATQPRKSSQSRWKLSAASTPPEVLALPPNAGTSSTLGSASNTLNAPPTSSRTRRWLRYLDYNDSYISRGSGTLVTLCRPASRSAACSSYCGSIRSVGGTT